jgi:hypothetical protein
MWSLSITGVESTSPQCFRALQHKAAAHLVSGIRSSRYFKVASGIRAFVRPDLAGGCDILLARPGTIRAVGPKRYANKAISAHSRLSKLFSSR